MDIKYMTAYGPEPDFFERVVGTILEGDFEILFNLYLVYRGARTAFLFESGRFASVRDATLALKTIATKYPEFQRTTEEAGRYFFHIKPLPTQMPGESVDHWIGRVLGFTCAGDINENRDKIRWSINYSLILPDDTEVSLYTEICSHEIELDKLDSWGKAANELGLHIRGYVTEIIPNIMWQKAIIGKDLKWLLPRWNKFVETIEGYGIVDVYNLLNRFKGKQDIIGAFNKYYPYILISVLRFDQDPMEPLYPINVDQAALLDEAWERVLTKSLRTRGDPVDYLLDFLEQSELQEVLAEKKMDIEELNISFNDFVGKYMEFL